MGVPRSRIAFATCTSPSRKTERSRLTSVTIRMIQSMQQGRTLLATHGRARSTQTRSVNADRCDVRL
jgi:hypothetical protein